ncbi:MAG: tripartite tricarboxylate transporter substrate binding protein [Betaproteobacteria bacterium]|nr:tripartite tricarboxylate transporter substrate binding protein [Betaproteobacteria bacterium]
MLPNYEEKEFTPRDLTQTSQLVRLAAQAIKRFFAGSAEGPHGSRTQEEAQMKPGMLQSTLCLLAGCALLVPGAASTAADAYPSRPVRIIAPFSPGASTDIVGRLLAAKLAERWRQTVVVENRAGAGGTIGATYVAKSPPDGYTLLMGSVGSLGTVGLRKNLVYDPNRDFAPITLGVRAASVLAVHPSVPVKTVKELIAFARARPGELNYATAGSGAPSHLAMELFNYMAGVKIVHIPFKGPAEASIDLVTGRSQLAIQSVVSTISYYQSGRLRVLATTGRERMRELPKVPTMGEAGLPGYEVYVWYGVLAPAGTPREIIEKLNKELVRIFHLPDVRDKLLAQGGELATGTPEEFAAFIKNDVEKWNRVIKVSGARVN